MNLLVRLTKVMVCGYLGEWFMSVIKSRVSRSYLILFYPIFLAKSYLILFFEKCPILSYFLPILPLILIFYSLLSLLFYMRTSTEIFSLASLGIKILFVHIMLESNCLALFTVWPPVKFINVGENTL